MRRTCLIADGKTITSLKFKLYNRLVELKVTHPTAFNTELTHTVLKTLRDPVMTKLKQIQTRNLSF